MALVMTRRFSFRVVAMAVAALFVLSAPAVAHKRPHAASVENYINPFTAPGWEASRTDMGVDWVAAQPEPVLAIGDAVILGSDWHAPWPGKRLIWYELTDGSHAGDVIYVAENLRHLLAAGTRVRAGQKIAEALPGYPGTEWGWADQYGTPISLPCYREGRPTSSGKRMARFMEELGAAVGDPVALAGPDGPTGKLC